MIRQRTHPAATQSTRRLEAFTDGVFAIAATLLVLDLTSRSLGDIDSDAALWAALGALWQPFFNFVLSFLLLCMLWMIHSQQFEHVARVDGTLMWLNNARLLFIVLVPFSTSLTVEYSKYYAGRLAMPVTFFFAVLMGWLQWSWAVRRRSELTPDLPEAEARGSGRGALSAVVIGAAVVLVAPLVGSIAFVLFLLDPFLTKLLQGRGGRDVPPRGEERPE